MTILSVLLDAAAAIVALSTLGQVQDA